MAGYRQGTSHELISNELDWSSLSDRREGVKLKNLPKIMNNETHLYLQTLIPEIIGTKIPHSRNPDDFYAVRFGIETYRK